MLDEEGALARSAFRGIHGCLNEKPVGAGGAAYKALGAVEDPTVTVFFRIRRERGRVGARAWFCHPKACPTRTIGLEEGTEVLLFLLVGSHADHALLGKSWARHCVDDAPVPISELFHDEQGANNASGRGRACGRWVEPRPSCSPLATLDAAIKEGVADWQRGCIAIRLESGRTKLLLSELTCLFDPALHVGVD